MSASAPKDIDGGTFNVGDTDQMVFPIYKDGSPWAGIDSVTLTFEAPDRVTTFDREAEVYDDAAGKWSYTTAVDDFTEVGYWTVRVKAVQGAIVKRYAREVSFYMNDQP